jgi:hypothetical protein
MKYAYPFLLCIIVLAVALYQFLGLQLVGFPDGHVTDYDSYAVPLYTSFATVNVIFGIYFGSIGVIAIKNREHVSAVIAILLYALLCSVVIGVDYYLWISFDHGQGG